MNFFLFDGSYSKIGPIHLYDTYNNSIETDMIWNGQIFIGAIIISYLIRCRHGSDGYIYIYLNWRKI